MTTKKRSAEEFLERFSFDLAAAVSEDDELLEEELKSVLGAKDLIDRIRSDGLRAVARARRERMLRAAEEIDHPREEVHLYASLGRSALISIIMERFRQAGPSLAVQHRNLESLATEDLRSLLEELDRLGEKK